MESAYTILRFTMLPHLASGYMVCKIHSCWKYQG